MKEKNISLTFQFIFLEYLWINLRNDELLAVSSNERCKDVIVVVKFVFCSLFSDNKTKLEKNILKIV